MADPKEKRKHQRLPIDGKLKVSWTEATGASKECLGHIVDASESGFRVVVSQHLEVRSYVHVRVDRYGFRAVACMRYSVRSGHHHAAGLEFAGGVQFRMPQTQDQAAA